MQVRDRRHVLLHASMNAPLSLLFHRILEKKRHMCITRGGLEEGCVVKIVRHVCPRVRCFFLFDFYVAKEASENA